jgi:NitT/TauT family transport system substrate-binding protein
LKTGKHLPVGLQFAIFISLAWSCSIWAAEQIPLKASYAAISGNFAPIWVAQDKGLFAKYGLAVDLNFVPPSTATQSLVGRSLDIIAPGGEIVEAGLAGEKVAYIASIANRVVLSLYGKREIQGLAGLKGRVMAVLTPGGTSDLLARILAQEAGLTPGKDIRILYMKSAPEILAALTQGNADAGIISAPMTLQARQLGFKEIVDVVGKNIPMIHSSLASTRDFIKEHRDRVRRFLQGYIEGIKVARSNAEDTKKIIGKYTKISGQEDLEETYKTFVGAWDKVPYVSSAAVQTILNLSSSPNAKTAKPEQFIDNSVIEEIERSGFINQLYQP